MNIIKSIFNQLILKDFFHYVSFFAKCTMAYRQTIKYQKSFDQLNPKLPNRDAFKIAKTINKNNKKWAGFCATAQINRHGVNNAGVKLNFRKLMGKGLGIDFKIGI